MTTVYELRDRLQDIPLFAGCNPVDLLAVAQRCEVRHVPPQTQLIQQGDVGDEFFVLMSGTAERGHGIHTIHLRPGDWFGELALLDPAPRSLDVVTTSECVIGVLTRLNFLLVLDAVPGVAPAMLAQLARRLRVAEIRNVDSH